MRELQLWWDPAKAEANLKKHGISFEEAADSLDDSLAVVRFDDEHSNLENRFVLVGESGTGRLLTVIFTIRGDFARIISARESTRTERRRYMEEKPTIREGPTEVEDMLEEYGHLEGWRRNPFRFTRTEGIVVLDPDVIDVFQTSEEVNAALRILIAERRKTPDANREVPNVFPSPEGEGTEG